jgi:hypothetical protein
MTLLYVHSGSSIYLPLECRVVIPNVRCFLTLSEFSFLTVFGYCFSHLFYYPIYLGVIKSIRGPFNATGVWPLLCSLCSGCSVLIGLEFCWISEYSPKAIFQAILEVFIYVPGTLEYGILEYVFLSVRHHWNLWMEITSLMWSIYTFSWSLSLGLLLSSLPCSMAWAYW